MCKCEMDTEEDGWLFYEEELLWLFRSMSKQTLYEMHHFFCDILEGNIPTTIGGGRVAMMCDMCEDEMVRRERECRHKLNSNFTQ